MDVKVIASRYSDRKQTDPAKRIFRIADHIVADPKEAHSELDVRRMYVGDAFRATVITLTPGQEQETHLHPATDHAWFIVSGTGEVTMEDDRRETVGPGLFLVHPRSTVHGVRNTSDENFVYIALSTGD